MFETRPSKIVHCYYGKLCCQWYCCLTPATSTVSVACEHVFDGSDNFSKWNFSLFEPKNGLPACRKYYVLFILVLCVYFSYCCHVREKWKLKTGRKIVVKNCRIQNRNWKNVRLRKRPVGLEGKLTLKSKDCVKNREYFVKSGLLYCCCCCCSLQMQLLYCWLWQTYYWLFLFEYEYVKWLWISMAIVAITLVVMCDLSMRMHCHLLR